MITYAYTKAHAINDFSLEEMSLQAPEPGPFDVLVRIKSSSFNPVDTKIRQKVSAQNDQPVVLGWDASGVIEKVGEKVKGFAAGDEVFYAGAFNRQGSNAELQSMDYRIISKKPESLSFPEAAALPLTSLTAWESLFERGFEYTPDTKVLIIGGAGGVGSMATQLVKALTPATVIVTATRKETQKWCSKMGADHIIGRDIRGDLNSLGIKEVDIIFSTTHTGDYLDTIPEILRPFGSLVLIDDPGALDIIAFKSKALSVHWESMFAKSMNGYHIEQQGQFLAKLAALVDEGKIQSTLKMTLPRSLESVRKAHELLESGKSLGKIVMDWR